MKLLLIYNSLSIKYKLLLSIGSTIVILLGVFIAMNYYAFTKGIDNRYEVVIQKKENVFNKANKTLSENSLSTASIFANLSQVKEAFLLIKQTNNDNCSSFFLNEEFNSINKELKLITGNQANIHFINTNGFVIYEFGSSTCANSVEITRTTFTNVIKSKIAYSGLDVINKKMVITSIVPVIDGTNIIGAVEVYYKQDEFYAIINKDRDDDFTILLNNYKFGNESKYINGKYIAYKTQSINIDEIFSFDKSKQLKFYDDGVYGIFPFNSGEYKGEVLYKISNEQAKNEKNKRKTLMLISIIIIIGLISFIIYFTIIRTVLHPLDILTKNVSNLAKGIVGKDLDLKYNDEIGLAIKANNELMHSIRNASNFASEIGKGKLNIEYNAKGDDDELGNSLIMLRSELLDSFNKEEIQKKENVIRNWVNEGLAKFGDILRQNNDNITKLSDNLLNNLVYYVDAVQGGLFLLDEDGQKLELVSSYAYDRKKFIEKKILIKEGLLGACILEKKYIYLKQVPEDYIEITSGLGDASPNYILIVPLIFNNETLGVYELAFLKDVEEYKLDFCNNIAESIASTLTSAKINKQTSVLLEQTQQQTEEMSAQEEEMRQNMEEMQATQEESSRKENEFKGVLNAIDNTISRIELNTEKELIVTNEIFLNLTGYSLNSLKSRKLNSIISDKFVSKYEQHINIAIENRKHTSVIIPFVKENGTDLLLSVSITPIISDEENIIKLELLLTEIKKNNESDEFVIELNNL